MSRRDLLHDNTLGVHAEAERAVEIHDDRQLEELVAAVGRQPFIVLGGGSNVVLRARVPGLVCLMRTRGYREDPQADGSVLVSVAAGERWHDVVRRTLGRGLAGLENLALIPGSVGAAPIQNIGAYGVELAERLEAVRVLDPGTGNVHRLPRSACGFGYRDSRFKHGDDTRLIVLGLTLRLHHRSAPVLGYPDLEQELDRLGRRDPSSVDVAEAVIRVRRRKLPDPRIVGNVGSFFKNPIVRVREADELRQHWPALTVRPVDGGLVKLSAAQLIDAGGWKGRRRGAVEVWHRHALVLCHRGGGSGADVLALGEDIRRQVRETFGVTLELEPRVIGQD